MFICLRTISLLVLVISYCTEASDWMYDDDSSHSGTDGAKGTAAWGDKCKDSSQSPIDIEPDKAEYAEYVEPFDFSDYSRIPTVGQKFTILNKGYTVQLKVSSANISIGGGGLPCRYTLEQIHLHWGDKYDIGSEHTINGWSYPLEIHFVHYSNEIGSFNAALNQSGGLAVLGVFAQVKKVAFRHEGLNSITQQLKAISYKDDSTEIDRFPIRTLLPINTNEYYRYSGSLTTPPCFESVIWTVFRQPISISPIQLQKFRTVYRDVNNATENLPLVNNFRPVQPLNHRLVIRTFAVASDSMKSPTAQKQSMSGH